MCASSGGWLEFCTHCRVPLALSLPSVLRHCWLDDSFTQLWCWGCQLFWILCRCTTVHSPTSVGAGTKKASATFVADAKKCCQHFVGDICGHRMSPTQKNTSTFVGNISRKIGQQFFTVDQSLQALQRSAMPISLARTRWTTAACFDWQVADTNFCQRQMSSTWRELVRYLQEDQNMK